MRLWSPGFAAWMICPEAKGGEADWSRAELTKRQIGGRHDARRYGNDPRADGRRIQGSRSARWAMIRRSLSSATGRALSASFSGRISARLPIRRLMPCAKRHVMSLKTRFSNLANILDENSQNDDVLVLESPVLTTADYQQAEKRVWRSGSRNRLLL